MRMDEQMDHGPLLYVERVRLTGKETLEDLSNKLFQLAADQIPDTIRDFTEGRIKAQAQNHDEATFCKEITKEDGLINPGDPPSPEVLDRMIRAYYPWPGVWLRWNEKIVKLYPHGVIQVEGKNPTSYKSFINGYKDGKELLGKFNLI